MPKKYTQEEIDIIIKYFPIEGSLCAKRINRTPGSVSSKAKYLKLKSPKSFRYWTEEELDIIRNYFPIRGKKLCKQYLPDRSEECILGKAFDLKVDYHFKLLKTWTPEEIEFLKENYSTKGSKYCSEILDKDRRNIRAKAIEYNLKADKKSFYINRQGNYIYRDFSKLTDFSDPKIVYLLGLLWADGYVGKTSISISNVSEDMNEIITKLNIEDLFPGVSINEQQPQRFNWKPQTKVCFYDKALANKFKVYKYIPQRLEEPVILEYIPLNLLRYWIRGFLDGDGCIHKKSYNVIFTGHSLSTYYFLEKICKHLGISYKSFCGTKKHGGKFSDFQIRTKNDCIKFLEFVYKDWDNIGLDRKYQRALNYGITP
jgi:hypothetical protein